MSRDKSLLQDVIGWDVANWSMAMRCWDNALADSRTGLLAIDIGCGSGGVSLYLGLKGYRVLCTDYLGDMKEARILHRTYGVLERMRYLHVSATALSIDDNTVDIIAFKSVLGAVGREGDKTKQCEAMREFHRVLKPGGILLFAENLAGSRVHMLARRYLRPWGQAWRYVTIEEMLEFTRSFSERSFGTFGFLAALGATERQRDFLHHVDRALNLIIAPNNRYIIYGYARK